MTVLRSSLFRPPSLSERALPRIPSLSRRPSWCGLVSPRARRVEGEFFLTCRPRFSSRSYFPLTGFPIPMFFYPPSLVQSGPFPHGHASNLQRLFGSPLETPPGGIPLVPVVSSPQLPHTSVQKKRKPFLFPLFLFFSPFWALFSRRPDWFVLVTKPGEAQIYSPLSSSRLGPLRPLFPLHLEYLFFPPSFPSLRTALVTSTRLRIFF